MRGTMSQKREFDLQEDQAIARPSEIPDNLQRYIAMAINQALARPQEAPLGPPIDSLVLDNHVMEEDRLAWQQIASQ